LRLRALLKLESSVLGLAFLNLLDWRQSDNDDVVPQLDLLLADLLIMCAHELTFKLLIG
jgi:hypothetical protein